MEQVTINGKAITTETPIKDIATIIKADWKNVNYAAKPYLNAMSVLEKITDNYYCDSAKSVVLYFLANAGTWKGETARTVKQILIKKLQVYKMGKMKTHIKGKKYSKKTVVKYYYQDGACFYDAETKELIAAYPEFVDGDYDVCGMLEAEQEFLIDFPMYKLNK